MSCISHITCLVLIFCIQYSQGDADSLSPPYTCTTTTTRCYPGETSEKLHSEVASSYPHGRPDKEKSHCQCDVSQKEINELRSMIGQLSDSEKFQEIERRLNQLEGNEVNCTEDDKDGWTVIQRRMDGSVDFYRGWDSYVEGFGNPSGEYWIGLDALHKMTTERPHKLRIELMNWKNETKYAEYSQFQVGDEESKYMLSVQGFSGTAKDGMAYHNHMMFSTFDSDNDKYKTQNCAEEYSGAWWYKSCYSSNLNGKYFPSPIGRGGKGISWTKWLGDNYSLKFVEMKIKPN